MDRYYILSALIEKASGMIFDGRAIWEDIENAVGLQSDDSGCSWVTGQDDVVWKWEYDVEWNRIYDEEFDSWETEINLLKVSILEKRTMKKWIIPIKGATL